VNIGTTMPVGAEVAAPVDVELVGVTAVDAETEEVAPVDVELVGVTAVDAETEEVAPVVAPCEDVDRGRTVCPPPRGSQGPRTATKTSAAATATTRTRTYHDLETAARALKRLPPDGSGRPLRITA
jgi:hypothetical protein